jgi:hypothetical protein
VQVLIFLEILPEGISCGGGKGTLFPSALGTAEGRSDFEMNGKHTSRQIGFLERDRSVVEFRNPFGDG